MLRDWGSLSAEEQLRLREEYGHFLDDLPPSCDPNTKDQRFRDWLASRGVNWQGL